MNINGEVVISAPRCKVWRALNDPVVLIRCIEGCETLERVKDQQFTGRVTAKIGSVKASFSGDVTITNIVPDVSYTIRAEGKAIADVQLEDQNDGKATRLTYTAWASVSGKLAQFDNQLIEATAKAQADKFFASLAAEVAPAEALPDAPTVSGPSGGLPSWVWIGLLLASGVALLVVQLS